ncbi:hypothetical protein UlMin_035228 [Ulmus minor]
MDSGNSGSMQSSSGGDEEFDSRPESIPSFLNPSTQFNSDSNQDPSSLLSHFQTQPMFDLSSNYLQLQAFSQSQPNSNPNFFLNPRGLRSEPSLTNLGNPPQSVLASHQGAGPSSGDPFPGPSTQLQSLQNDTTSARVSSQPKNSKKRTRASRRAPTTVLTTDTSNFRAMVQEFTGIPAPPFSGSPYSRRFDLFGSGSSIRSGHLDNTGPLYPLRPSAHKAQQSPFPSSSSSSPLLGNTIVDATNIATTSNTNFHPFSSNFQLGSSDHQVLGKQNRNMVNMQNPILTFNHSLSNPSLNMAGSSFGSEKAINLSINPLDQELNASHGVIMSYEGSERAAKWREGVGGKLNYSGSSSEFQQDKGLEMNVSSRGEGTVDSWIFPSE